jgi:two-component system, chemotaxis family, CheB/CheR fusion protein
MADRPFRPCRERLGPSRWGVVRCCLNASATAQLPPHVFGVFTQAPRTLDRAKEGLGLGLPLANRLVEMHGGRSTASSPGLGQGSEFAVTLPRVLERRSKARLEEDERRSSRPPAVIEVRPFRILVVDDEDDIRDTLADLLQGDGHETRAVGSGLAALEAVRTFDPEVVFLDIGLPGMDGYDVASKLREEHATKTMLVIALTGYQNDGERLKQAGFDEHVIKPPNLQKLAALLAAWDRGGAEVAS